MPGRRYLHCTCCKTFKKSGDFSQNPNMPDGYTRYCRDCGCWLTLFRQVFGPVRDWQKNREGVAERKRALRAVRQPANDLYAAWGIRRAA